MEATTTLARIDEELERRLRHPLAAIRNAAQVIRQLGADDGPMSEALAAIDHQVHLLSGLVDDLLVGTRSRMELAEEGEPESLPERAAARKVPVADDNRDSAESLGMLLEMAGHEVRLSYDGEETLALAASFQPEVLLLDIGLPKMDGFEVASRLRQDPSLDGMLLVAVTGYGTDGDRERGRAAGFDHHLVKPVDPDDLKNLIAGARREVTV